MTAVPKSRFDVLQNYLSERCTGHGFPRCSSTPSMGGYLRRFHWLIISIGFTGFCFWQVYNTWVDFANFPTITSLTVEGRNRLEFPSVSVCPLQPFNERVFEDIYSTYFTYLYPHLLALPIIDNFKRGRFHDAQELSNCKSVLNASVLDQYGTAWLTDTPGYVRECCPKTTANFIDMLEKLHVNVTEFSKRMICSWSMFMYTEWALSLNSLKIFLNEIGLKTFYTEDSAELQRKNITREDVLTRLTYWTTANFLASVDTGRSIREIGRVQTDHSKKTNLTFSRFLEDTKVSVNSRSPIWWSVAKTLSKMFSDEGFLNTTDDDGSPSFWIQAQAKFALEDTVRNGDFFVTQRNASVGARHVYQFLKHPITLSVRYLIIECSFLGEDCIQMLHNTIDPKWKSCVHFNNEFLHDENSDDNDVFFPGNNSIRKGALVTDRAGKDGALLLRFVIPTRNMMELIAESDGFAVAIGDPAAMPNLYQFVTITGNRTSDIIVTRREIHRLRPEDGGHCAKEDYFKVAFPSHDIVGLYNQDACYRILTTLAILEKCECVMNNDILGGIIGIQEMLARYDTCSQLGPDKDCVAEVVRTAEAKVCPPACTEVRFQISTTATEIKLDNRRGYKAQGNLDKLNHMKDFPTKLYVYYETLTTEVMTETAVYTTIGFIADIGGLAGLYVGISLVTLVELLELLFDLITFRWWDSLRKLRKKITGNPQPSSQQAKDLKPLDLLEIVEGTRTIHVQARTSEHDIRIHLGT